MCRLLRVLLLTSFFLLLFSAAEPPPPVLADGDPDEVIERKPKGRELPAPPPGIPPEGGLGDPDEVIEGDPFAPRGEPGAQGVRGVVTSTYWLAVETLRVTWLFVR
jgi:hypothetical protein